ncbi:hypothetical protein AB0878_43690 [Amycolatopsis sp. NPDC047767]
MIGRLNGTLGSGKTTTARRLGPGVRQWRLDHLGADEKTPS